MPRLLLSYLSLCSCVAAAVAAGPGEMPYIPHPGEGIGLPGFLWFVAVLLLSFFAMYLVIHFVGNVGSRLNPLLRDGLAGAAGGALLTAFIMSIIDQIFGLTRDNSFAMHDFVLIAVGAVGVATFAVWVRLRDPYL